MIVYTVFVIMMFDHVFKFVLTMCFNEVFTMFVYDVLPCCLIVVVP
jgi:hypothetical protein